MASGLWWLIDPSVCYLRFLAASSDSTCCFGLWLLCSLRLRPDKAHAAVVQDSIGAGKFEDHVPPETTQLLVTRWAKELDPANDEFWDCIYPLPVDGEQPSLARPRLRHCRLDGAELAKTHEKALCERLVPLIRKGQAGVEELVVFCEKLEKHLKHQPAA